MGNLRRRCHCGIPSRDPYLAGTALRCRRRVHLRCECSDGRCERVPDARVSVHAADATVLHERRPRSRSKPAQVTKSSREHLAATAICQFFTVCYEVNVSQRALTPRATRSWSNPVSTGAYLHYRSVILRLGGYSHDHTLAFAFADPIDLLIGSNPISPATPATRSRTRSRSWLNQRSARRRSRTRSISSTSSTKVACGRLCKARYLRRRPLGDLEARYVRGAGRA